MKNDHSSIISWPLIIIIVILGIISIFTIKSAHLYINEPDATTFWIKQLLFYGIGAAIIFAIYRLGSDRIYSSAWVLYWFLMILLIGLVLYRHLHIPIPFAKTTNGATSWYKLPGFTFQPSEFMKIILIIVMAKIATDHNNEYSVHDFRSDLVLIKRILVPVIPVCLLVLLQNDAGVTLIILASVIAVLYAAGLNRWWFIIGFGSIGIIVLIFALIFIFDNNLFLNIFGYGHSIQRLYGWLDPEGNYLKEGYQLYNAMMAYGTAGSFGHGFSSVIISLSEPQTDFIFALIALGYGFAGAAFTLLIIASFDFIILRIGLRSQSLQDQYFVAGIIGILFFQQIWNVSMILGLLPITGITLPLISYGGSSVISYMFALGIILDIEKQTNILQGKNRYN